MPGGVHGSVDERGGKNGARSAPGPAVEDARDGGQDHVAPVGKAKIRYVGEAEKHGGGPPACHFALRCARQSILQQAPEEKFFGPRREEENAKPCKRQRFPVAPPR